MPDIKKTIEIIFAGTDNLSNTLKTAGSNLETFGGELESFGQPFQNLTVGILAADAALTALAVGGLTLAFNKSVEFENSTIELQKVLGAGANVDKAIDEAFRLSDVYGESSASILESTASFKQAGFDLEDALLLTVDALDLVIAGSVEASRASELITATLKGFSAEAEEAGRLVDILNEVSNEYATDVAQLAEGMAKVSPIASQMGFTFEETAGLITPIIEVFRSGGEAAVALKTGLLKLIDDSKPVQEALKSIGVAQRNANGELRSGKDIYFDVAKAFQTMDENQKLFVTQQLVGLEQSARMVTVFDGLNKTMEITASAMGSAGSAAKEVAARLESAEVSVKRFKEGFTNLSIAVGDEFRLAAKEAIDGGTDIENSLRNIVKDGTFDPVFSKLNEFSLEIGARLSVIAKNLPEALNGVNFTALLDSFGDLRGEIQGMFDGIDLSTPEGLRDAIQSIINLMTSLVGTTSGIVESFQAMVGVIGDLINQFNEADLSKITGQFLGLGTQIGIVGGLLGTSGILIGGIGKLIGVISGGVGLAKSLGVLSLALTGPVGIAVGLAAVSAAVVSFTYGKILEEGEEFLRISEEQRKSIDELIISMEDIPAEKTSEIFVLIEDGDIEGAKKLIEELTAEEKIINLRIDSDQKELSEFISEWDSLSEDKSLNLAAAINAGDLDAIENSIAVITSDKNIDIIATADISKATEELSFFDEAGNEFKITVPVETEGIDDAKKKIEDIPTEKIVEITLQGNIDTEIARIETQADILQTAMELTAELNIENVKAQAQVLSAAFEGISSSVSSLTDSTASLFGEFAAGAENLSQFDQGILLRAAEKQQELQEDVLKSQIALTDAQRKATEAKTAAVERGDSVFTIVADPALQPTLLVLLQDLLKQTQIFVTEEGADALLEVT